MAVQRPAAAIAFPPGDPYLHAAHAQAGGGL